MYSLNIFLIKDKISDVKEVITEKHHDRVEPIVIPGCEEAYFVYKEPHKTEPNWYQYLSPLNLNLPNTLSNPSSVIVLKNKTGMFALAFGSGRYFIEDRATVSDFGLKVTLNAIPSQNIKTVDKKTMEQLGMHTRQQLIVPLGFSAFDIAVDRDLLKSVEGKVDDDFGKYLKGACSLAIVTDKPISKLSLLCNDLLKLYKKVDYKIEFGWIDNIKLIDEEEKIKELDEKLIKKIISEDYQGIFLGAPELMEDIKVKAFRFKGVNHTVDFPFFPSINQYKKLIDKKNKVISFKNIHNHKILAMSFDEPSKTVYQWSLYRCIHAEINSGKKTCKLHDGDWYEIDSSYLTRIENTVKQLPVCRMSFPDWHNLDKEKDYNVKLANVLKAACLDASFIKLRGKSKFEFCDVFTRSKQIIHVKKHSGVASISHLLFQAFVSAQAFMENVDSRKIIARKSQIKNLNLINHVNPKKFSTTDYTIILAIGTTKAGNIKDILSFFSKISLVHKVNVLSSLGYSVELTKIKIK